MEDKNTKTVNFLELVEWAFKERISGKFTVESLPSTYVEFSFGYMRVVGGGLINSHSLFKIPVSPEDIVYDTLIISKEGGFYAVAHKTTVADALSELPLELDDEPLIYAVGTEGRLECVYEKGNYITEKTCTIAESMV